MKIVLDVSDACEATAYPWWLILDPGKMWEGNAEGIASMVTGPFFSRESAEAYMKSHQYHYKRHGGYSDKAVVYCHTGHKSPEYVKAFEETKAGVVIRTRIKADADMG